MPHSFFRNKLHLSLLSALAAGSWSIYFGISVNGWMLLCVFLLTFSIYQDNRLTDDAEDATNDPDGLSQAIEHRNFIRYATFYPFSLLALLIAWQFGQPAFWATAVVILIGVLYNHHCFPAILSSRLNGARRMKDIFVIKNLVPPLDWAIALVFLPLLFSGRMLSLQAWICWGYVFCCAFFIEVMWDMRDRRGDLASGIRTIANTISFRQTKQLLIIASLASGALLFAFTFTGILPEITYFLLANNAAVIVIASLYREDREAFMRKISDLTIVLAGVLFLSFGLIAWLAA